MNPASDDEMGLEKAARVLGVHYQTVYRWVRSGVLPATKGAVGYRVARADVDNLAKMRQARRPLTYTGRGRDWNRLREQLHTALVAGDETAARRVFEMVYLARVPIVEQCEQLLAPSLRRIGDEWEAGELSGARVLVAAGICERSLDWAVARLDQAEPAQGVALVATPKGEDHRLPALLAGAALRGGGWQVHEVFGVGPVELVELADRIRPGLAVMSVTMADAADAADQARLELRESLGVPVLVGGSGETLCVLQEAAAALRNTLK